MGNLLLTGFYLLFPVLAIYLCYRYNFFNKIGAVVICYIVGITVGNIGILPAEAAAVQEQVSEAAVALALPLLLFSMDIKKWSRLAGKTMLSMALTALAIIIIASGGYFIIRHSTANSWQLAGMAVGVYTGGTPNLAAIKTALDIDSSRFIIVHTYDTVWSALYIIFSITIAQKFFNRFLPPFEKTEISPEEAGNESETEDIHSYAGMVSKRTLPFLGSAFLISAVIVGVSVTATSLAPEEYSTSLVMLLITTLGIAASLVKKIRNIEKSFQLGMYIIYIFCLVVGSMANYKAVIDIDFTILAYISAAIFGTMFLHMLFCRLLKIDTDTFIITSVSAICSPPFVPVVADALKNREVILSGLTMGIIGYAIGNYLGISVGIILKTWF